MNLKIAVVYNSQPKPCSEMKAHPDIYFPIIAGAAENKIVSDMPNVQYDNVGDNISCFNPYFNELTAMYWIGKHLDLLGNPDYIGLHHYRRFFDLEKDVLPNLDPNVLILSYERLALNMVDFLDLCHESGQYFYETAQKLFCVHVPFIKQCVDEYAKSTSYFSRNLFVIPSHVFPKLLDFIEQEMMIMAPDANYASYGYVPARHTAFVAERLTGLFFYLLIRTTSLKYKPVLFHYTDPEKDNEQTLERNSE
jgi:hypothetical protein